eukprot:CAMPEP_0119044362 /NCGR_PEP_ID=MMETSP1177-20130426/30912_1 /TAXON_ID=2985 /ORGANISM="Ochromonas sp, Strain CCMP1899" /LENGTH=594 /DNA_ID=CAMNT_0007014377 /DNA_START=123 /DNA_END=1904 /DNA_ORIENTATION=+
MNDIPNIPGMRRDISTTHPILYRQYKASRSQLESSAGDSLYQMDNNGREVIPTVECDFSFTDDGDGFATSQELKELSLNIQSFPTEADAFNDTAGRYSMRSQQIDRTFKVKSLPYSNIDTAPHFVANCKEPVCRVLAYYVESVGIQEERARKMEIVFYLEDSTLEVIEPYIPNCGIIQGRILKRHKVAKPPAYRKRQDLTDGGSGVKVLKQEEEYYSITDVYAGAKLMIYQKEFIVIDCDLSTRRLLAEHGTPFGESLVTPPTVYDPRILHSQALVARQKQIKSKLPKKTTGFFEYDRKVLRFYGIWDKSSQLFGDALRVRLHYYLADNTMEVLPIQGPSEGRDKVPKYLKKSHILMKPTEDAMQMSENSMHGLDTASSISVFDGPEVAGVDAVKPSRPYHWTDLRIGNTIAVAAINITIIDADNFTRDFYISKQMPLASAIPIVTPVYPDLDTSVPPHNGFGSSADSIQTCKGSLQPKSIRKDEAKLRKYQGMILRYFSSIKNPKSEDIQRKFIISIYLEDDTISISEPPIRNSGHKGGIFLSRSGLTNHQNRTIYPKDLFVGADIHICAIDFCIHDADEYTQRYMCENSHIW